jgi:hypothetical protein
VISSYKVQALFGLVSGIHNSDNWGVVALRSLDCVPLALHFARDDKREGGRIISAPTRERPAMRGARTEMAAVVRG